MFSGKILLITGGTGSFGKAVLNRFINSDIKEIRIFSRDEKKQDDLRRKINNKKVKFYIGDVRDFVSVEAAVRGVDYIFHAAALKQVPSCEFFPLEALKTNVLGTENVLRAAIDSGVKKVICLSTDKAVYPVNAMGMTKALMEKLFVARSRNLIETDTIICGTRYGNVMASRGSVIPLFMEQIHQNKPLTVTNPDMTRFMMTLEDAVNLVLYAFQNGEQGDIFVQKAPASTIGDLALAMKAIYEVSNEVKVIGTRHGEKLYETLVSQEEMVKTIDMGDYFKIPADNRDLNYEQYFEKGNELLSKMTEYHSHNTKRLGAEELKNLLLTLDVIQKDLKNSLNF